VTRRRLAMLSLVVANYDEAIEFYTRVMRFRLVEDTPMRGGKRWVVVAPDNDHGAQLLLARAQLRSHTARSGRPGSRLAAGQADHSSAIERSASANVPA